MSADLKIELASLAEQVARSALASMRSEQRGQLHVSTVALKDTRVALPKLLKEFPEIELIDVIEDVDLKAPMCGWKSAVNSISCSTMARNPSPSPMIC